MHNLEVNKIYIKNINPNKENPRQINDDNINKLTNSLNDFGLVEPIIINTKTNEIIGGHQRYKILLDEYNSTGKNKELFILNLGDISWVFSETDLKIRSKDHETALNITLNNDMAMGVYDESLLYDITSDLQEKGLLSLTQFEDSDLEELEVKLNLLDDQETEIVEDDYDIDQEVISKVNYGDIWKLGNHRLICSDSTKKETFKLLMNDKKARISFTSPPYNIGGGSENKKYINFNDNQSEIEYFDFLNSNLNLLIDNSIEVFYNIAIATKNKKQIFQLILNNYENFKDIIFWKKSAAIPSLPKGVIRNHIEFIIGFGKDNNRSFETANFKQGAYPNIIEGNNANNNEYSNIHKATFPLYLPENIIKNFSNKKDIIIDSFGGTGTTLIACEQLERRCYMIELEPQYCDIIISRWEEFTGEKATKIN